jgi:cell wall assembly regulator SMI1
MKEYWDRIERWLTANAPDILKDMRPGASADDIRWAEQQLGCAFPEEVREWCTIHNGSESCALLEYWDFHSLAEAVEAWRSLRRLYDSGSFNEFKSEFARWTKREPSTTAS